MIKCIIFDLDGTLINTLNDLAITANETLNEFGYDPIDIEKYRYFVGNGIRKLIERCLVENNIDLINLDKVYNKFLENYNLSYLRYASIYEGMNEVLNILKEDGYLLFVNTNKNDQIAKAMINHFFKDIFIDVYGDSINYPRKPDPFIINKIKIEYNLNNDEIIYIGDSNVDVKTAHNAFVKAIGCAYGFRGKEELINAKVDYLITKPLEILKIIKNSLQK